MKQEKISVIVPVYKVEEYLGKCIQSILNQTMTDLEVILVDDGSPDACGRICDQYARKDARIKVIHKENGGLSSARNAGMEVASGEYLMFVDSDDWIAEDMVEYLYQGLQQSQADMSVCSNYQVKKGKYIPGPKYQDQVLGREEALAVLCEDTICKNYAWGKLFSRRVLEGVCFPEGMNFEDIPTVYQAVLKADKVALLSEPKYYYLIRGTGIAKSRNIKNSIDRCKAHRMRYEQLKVKYPKLCQTMERQAFYAVRLLVLEVYKSKREIWSPYEEEIRACCGFVRRNKTALYENPEISQAEHRQIDYIAKGNPKRFYKIWILEWLRRGGKVMRKIRRQQGVQ